MTEHRITTPHGTVAVVDYDGGGPDVLLLPGGGGTLADWAPVRPYLRGRRVVAIDFRWNGLSSDEGDVSLEANADDAEAIIDALGLDNPAIPDTRSAAWSRPSTRHDTRAVPVSPNLDGHGRGTPDQYEGISAARTHS
jgi:pimeloyl-ACP methyl ester carboxylesterase